MVVLDIPRHRDRDDIPGTTIQVRRWLIPVTSGPDLVPTSEGRAAAAAEPVPVPGVGFTTDGTRQAITATNGAPLRYASHVTDALPFAGRGHRSEMSEETEAVPAPVPRPIAWMDGRVVPGSEATVPLLDDGFLRGDAVFDAVLIRGGRTHALDAHLARLRRSAKMVGIRVPVLRQVVADLLAAWGDRDGSLKLIITRGGAVRGIIQPLANPPSIALQPIEMPWRTVLTGAKTLSYAANAWASRQARLAHADEALIVSEEGIVLEAPTAAIVWVRGGDVFTPDPGRLPILDSISVRELDAVAEVRRGEHHLDDVLGADEVFIVSASRPVLPVHAIDDTAYPAPGPRTRDLRDTYDAYIREVLDPGP